MNSLLSTGINLKWRAECLHRDYSLMDSLEILLCCSKSCNKISKAEHFAKQMGLFSSQFWTLNIQHRQCGPFAWPLMKACWLHHCIAEDVKVAACVRGKSQVAKR